MSVVQGLVGNVLGLEQPLAAPGHCNWSRHCFKLVETKEKPAVALVGKVNNIL